MRLVVGLGNPGPDYVDNRHNIGFMAVDEIVRRHSFGSARARFHALTAEATIDGEKVVALKPQTYMNEYGRAVGAAARSYKQSGEARMVGYDETALPHGQVRGQRVGGARGRNRHS